MKTRLIETDKLNEFNTRLYNIWNDHFPNPQGIRAPMLYTSLVKHGFVGMGCNPSFSKSRLTGILRNTQFSRTNLNTLYDWNRVKNNFDQYFSDSRFIEQLVIENYTTYFGLFKDFAHELKLELQPLDLFMYKETSQISFKNRIYTNGQFNQFALDQIDLFFDVLKICSPKLILVANAFVSDVLREIMAKDLVYKHRKGFYKYKGIPIFFSSMITGGNQLDKHSRERLLWHMKKSIRVNTRLR